MAYWVLSVTGDQNRRYWYGPYPDKESARSFAFDTYAGGRVEIGEGDPWYIRTKIINEEIAFTRRVYYGEGREKPEGSRKFWFTGEWFEVFARDIDGNHVITDDETERQRVEEDDETGEYCAGPLIDDWCEPCEGVQEIAELFSPTPWGEDHFFPIGPEGVEFIKESTGSAPYLYQTIVSPVQEELEAVVSAFGGDLDSVYSADGSNSLFTSFGWGRVARIVDDPGGFGQQYGYPATNFGTKWYVPDSQVMTWLENLGFTLFQFYEDESAPPWNPLAETFDEPQVYLLGYQVRVELFAQVVTGGNGLTFGSAYTARSRYDLDYYNQIDGFPGYPTYVFRNSIYTDFIPAGGGGFFGEQWFEQPAISVSLPAGFRHTNDLDGKVIGDMVGPWALAVNCQVTPLYKAANGYNDCDRNITGETYALTVIGRCPREAFQVPFPFPGLGSSSNPNFSPRPFELGIFREDPDSPNPPEQKTTPELWGWSGNGIDFPTLLLLNPTWAVNAFIDNWPPFKRVPGYKKMVEFIRYITGKRSQYQSIGTDPATGWEVYPVPVIVGADENGFPVYGPPVYKNVPAGGKYQ